MKNELINRTKLFALDSWKFCFKIPKSEEKELLAITVSSINTARRNQKKSRS